jgi:predicted nucleotidyltransferase
MQSSYDRIQYYEIGQERKNRMIAKLKKSLNADKRVELAWLFGSVTRRDRVRDIDVAVHAVPKLPFKDFLNLNVQLELDLGVPVDLVEIADAPESLRENILKNGIPIKESKSCR